MGIHVQTYELLLLGGTLAMLALLLPWKNKGLGVVPWKAVLISAMGIVVLVAHALRHTISTGLSLHELPLDPESAQWSTWRLIELGGLLMVGSGMVLLAQTAEIERGRAERQKRLDALAPNADISTPILRALAQTSPGTLLLLTNRAGSQEQPRFNVDFVDATGDQSVRRQGAGPQLLTEIYTPSLAAGIQSVACDSMSAGDVAQTECACADSGRFHRLSAAAHGQSVIVMLEDITERREAEASLRRVAYTDPVTGLANRPMLEKSLERTVGGQEPGAGDRFAIIYIDFDGFKRVNDDHGHHVGDALLSSIGSRIATVLESFEGRASDEHVAARWGGDEFVVLLGESRVREVDAFAQRLLRCLAEPHEIEGIRVVSTASIGVAVCRGQYESPMDAVRDADAAMYEAKRLGRNRIIKGGEIAGRSSLRARRREDWAPSESVEVDAIRRARA